MSTLQGTMMPSVRRSTAALLVSFQIAGGVPHVSAATRGAQAPRPAAQPTLTPRPAVRVNRTVPAVTPPPTRPVFSSIPTDAEILAARVLPEPVVPIGESSPEENIALAAALSAFATARESNTMGAVGQFMETHPTSVWQPSLLLNAGLVMLRQGFFTRAAQDFRIAWTLAKNAPVLTAHRVADQAIGELIRLESRLGHADTLDALITEVGERPLLGAANELFSNGKQALWVMQNAPEEAFRCGPYALAELIGAIKQTSIDAKLLMTRTGPNGISLARLVQLAAQAGVATVPVVRESGDAFGVPGVVHLKAGHFAALLRHEGDRYLLRDATMGGELWVTATALNEEASGAMLVLEGGLPSGWRAMSMTDAGDVWGRGFATGPDPSGPPPGPATPPCECGNGMATYRAHLMEASLNVFDTPLGYTPALGPAVQFTVSYVQRESHQPQTFTYSNLGAKWTLDWLSYVTDDPANANATVKIFGRGAGEEPHGGYDSGTGRYAINVRDRVQLTRTSSSPIRYERALPDGSKEVFAQPDGASAYPRRVFMTQSIDPQGNALTFTYDAQSRLIAVTDALGQVTTLAYELPQDIWKITKITDPFGRFATLSYDAAGRLERITDVIQLWSAFTYAADGFLTSLTTPYGASRFTVMDTGYNRTLEMTDPLGAKERLEYRANDASMATSDPAPTVPTVTGATFNNAYLQYRNTLYWDRKAMAVAPGDRTKAHLYHWLHVRDNVNQTVAILESEKAALENRVWYLYPNQASAIWEGDGRSPSMTARVLDDGITQAYKVEYNAQGQITKRTDPLGRETVFTYATNGIDLLTVSQKNGAGYDLLETRTYNNQHEPLIVTDAAGQATTYAYNGVGQVATITNAKNETTTYTYTANQLTGVTGAVSGAPTTFTYDGYNRLRTTTDSDNYTITTDYDAFDRPTQVTYPDGTTEQTRYRFLDVTGRKDRLGRWTTFTYDAMRRQTSVRDPLGRLVQQEWCTCGSLNTLIDANGNRTSWDRDVQGRVTKETRANGSFTTYVYETTTSRLKKVTDPRLQDTNYAYFTDNKLQQTSYTNAVIATPSVGFTYDSTYGRIATMVDGAGTTTYGYHPVITPPALGATRLASVDGPLTDDTITYEYDELGRIVSRSINGAANTVAWAFDALGRTTSEANPLGLFLYTYDGSTARVATVTYPNGQTGAYSYFGNAGDRRLHTIHHKYPNGTTLSKFDYTYDVSGNILTWRQQADNDAALWSYAYDAADQLTGTVKASTDPTPAILKRYTYAYDPAGNRTVEQIDDAVMGATYDNMNRLVSQQPSGTLRLEGTVSEPATVMASGKPLDVSASNRFTGSIPIASGTTPFTVTATDSSGNTISKAYEVDSTGAGKTLTFDANGNMTSDGTRTFEWNGSNDLAAVSWGSRRVEYLYDGLHRIVERTERDGSQIMSQRTSVWCDVSECEIRDSNGANLLVAKFLRGSRTSTTHYHVGDHLNSLVAVTDSSGSATSRYSYDPWGRRTLTFGVDNDEAAFGNLRTESTGLYSGVFRQYDPEMGRWIREDPIAADPQYGVFTYARSNPTGFVDPTGLQGRCITATASQWIGPKSGLHSLPSYQAPDYFNLLWFNASCPVCDETPTNPIVTSTAATMYTPGGTFLYNNAFATTPIIVFTKRIKRNNVWYGVTAQSRIVAWLDISALRQLVTLCYECSK